MARAPRPEWVSPHQTSVVDEDDDAFPPDANYLARFRKPFSDAELDGMVRLFEEAVAEWLAEIEGGDQPSLPGLLPEER